MNYKKIIYGLNNWLVFFLLAGFVTTCCMTLFVTVVAETLDLTFTEQNISTAAKLTFGNVVLLSILFTAIDAVRRRLMVERPTRRIVSAAEKITKGDFTVRIEPLNDSHAYESFNSIIDCLNKMATDKQPYSKLPGVSLLKPLKGVDPNLINNLETFFELDYPKVSESAVLYS